MNSSAELSFAEQLQRFRDRTTKQRGQFRALILPGTRQAITAALLIGGLEPERVAFLLTDQTRTLPAAVADLLGCSAETWLTPPGDHAATSTVYTGIKQVLAHWSDISPAAIAVDVTGGFAPMSVGIAKAAHVLHLTTLYILSEYDPATNRVKPGTQRLEFPPDPYTVFGDLEAREAQQLFKQHDYAGAKRIFATLEQRVPAPDNAPYRAYTLLADAYAAWEVFDWKKAATALKTLLADTAPLPDAMEPEHARLQAQHDALQQLQNDNEQWKKKPPLTLLADLQSILPLLGSLYANAKRREAQKRYDVAALFHYRCLELISQHRLAAWGILTERPDYTAVQQHGIRARELDARYRQVEHTLFPRERGLPYAGQPISLFNGYMLLAALDDPLVHTFSIKQIRERTDARNKSMLAHGFRLITETEYQAFYGVVDELLTRFFTVSAQDRSAWEQRYQFVCPFATRPES
jgi:CRISPR-associated protein (TIGR02710 family)